MSEPPAEPAAEAPKKLRRWVASLLFSYMFLACIYVVLLLLLSNDMLYWKNLFSKSWADTWILMGDAKNATLVIAVAVFLFTFIFIRLWNGHGTAKDFAIETTCGVLAVLLVGFLIFLAHFFIMTPQVIFSELQPKPLFQKSKVEKKALPDVVLPALEIPQAAPVFSESNEPAPVDASKQLVTNTPVNSAPKSITAKIKAEIDADDQKKKEKAEAQLAADKRTYTEGWKSSSLVFNDALKLLYETLKSESDDQNDTLVYPRNYFQSVPSNMGFDAAPITTTSIKFEKKPDISFDISILERDSSQRRIFQISCKAGYIQLRHEAGQNFYIGIKTSHKSTGQICPYAETRAALETNIDYLVGEEILEAQ